MDEITVVSNGNAFTCMECGNPNNIAEGTEMNRTVECMHCGIEYRINEVTGEGNFVLEIIEEEK